MQSTPNPAVIGMDIAKNVFQIHTVDPATGEIVRLRLKRQNVSAFFAQRQPALVAMEACGGAHHWARLLQAMGHTVKLLPARPVRAFVTRDKTDARDAQAIYVAAQQPHIHAVPVKSELQQACLALHRMRAQLMKMRIMQSNALRGLLYEFGVVFPKGCHALLERLPAVLAQEEVLPAVVRLSAQEQLQRIGALQEDIERLDKRLAAVARSNQQMRAVQAVPGIGPLTASALVATATDPFAFKSARQFAAWLGLTPRQEGTGGRVWQLGISKRGDAYVRTLLVHGARAVLTRSAHTRWLRELLARRPFNVVVVALAAKLARTAWAILARGVAFDARRWSPADAQV